MGNPCPLIHSRHVRVAGQFSLSDFVASCFVVCNILGPRHRQPQRNRDKREELISGNATGTLPQIDVESPSSFPKAFMFFFWEIARLTLVSL